MQLGRQQLIVLLNALFDTDTVRVSASHPSDDIGELLEFELGHPTGSRIGFSKSIEEYADSRSDIKSRYGSPVVNELPELNSYVNAPWLGGYWNPPITRIYVSSSTRTATRI
jgi:hypothetical protein